MTDLSILPKKIAEALLVEEKLLGRRLTVDEEKSFERGIRAGVAIMADIVQPDLLRLELRARETTEQLSELKKAPARSAQIW
tara:strand:- start:8642 stop:8887 length:246 start_codon:yes stop_codon:yes gene_type:complete